MEGASYAPVERFESPLEREPMKAALLFLPVTALALALNGCGAKVSAANAAPPAPEVGVAPVIARSVADTDEFSGRFRAVDRVEVRPRVSGYIASSQFVEGREVKKGDVLFVIDPRPYEADLKRAKAELARAREQLALAGSQRERAQRLLQQNAISREEAEALVSASVQSDANVQAAQAALDVAALNLQWTQVTAPISGVIGRQEVTPGNLVSAGQTLLTTLVSVDPIYVEFDGDEAAYLKYVNPAVAARQSEVQTPVLIGLSNEQGYPHAGVIAFANNELDGETGTIRFRGRLNNSDRRFRPGMFARVKMVSAGRYDADLINDAAVGTDQDLRFVYVVDAANKVEYRKVTLGPLVDGLRVVREGLKPGENIVIEGLPRVRPGITVNPKRIAMGTPSGGTAALAINNAE
jgi:multidrug efflux system membrane fusion protein